MPILIVHSTLRYHHYTALPVYPFVRPKSDIPAPTPKKSVIRPGQHIRKPASTVEDSTTAHRKQQQLLPSSAKQTMTAEGKSFRRINVKPNPECERAGMKSYASLLKKCECSSFPHHELVLLFSVLIAAQTTLPRRPKGRTRKSTRRPKTSRTCSSRKGRRLPSLS